jgi:O-antigen ligase
MTRASRALLACIVFLLGVYLLLSPIWAPAVAPRMYDNARLLQLFVLVGAALALISAPVRSAIASSWVVLGRPVQALITVFLAGGAVSALLSPVPQLGALHVALIGLLLTLFFLVCAAVRALPAIEAVLGASLLAGPALLTLEFWTTFALHAWEGRAFSWVSPFLEFANVRFFSQYQAYALLLVPLAATVLPLKRGARWAAYLICAGFWSLQFMVGTRAVWVGFAAAVCMVPFFMGVGRLQWLRTQLLLMLGGGVIYALFASLVVSQPSATPIPQKNSILERGGESIDERKLMMLAAVRLVSEHPLTGVGPGQFGFHYSATPAAHPHNTPLQLLAEYGIVAGGAGIGLGVALVVFALRRLRQSSEHEPNTTTATLSAALIMGLTDSLFSGNLIMPHSQVLLVVVAGWLVGRSQRARSVGSVAPSRPLRTTLAGLALLCAAVTAILALEYLHVIRDMPYPPQLRAPNFWQYGRFDAW